MPQREASAAPTMTTPPTPTIRRRRSSQERQERRRRLLTWVLSAVLCILLVNALIGDNGYLATVFASREQAALQAEVARLRLENQRLQQESRRLQDDPAALEETARRELGLIRPGETLVILHDSQTPFAPAAK